MDAIADALIALLQEFKTYSMGAKIAWLIGVSAIPVAIGYQIKGTLERRARDFITEKQALEDKLALHKTTIEEQRQEIDNLKKWHIGKQFDQLKRELDHGNTQRATPLAQHIVDTATPAFAAACNQLADTYFNQYLNCTDIGGSDAMDNLEVALRYAQIAAMLAPENKDWQTALVDAHNTHRAEAEAAQDYATMNDHDDAMFKAIADGKSTGTDLALRLNQISIEAFNAGLYAPAAALARRAWLLEQAARGPDHAETLTSLSNLAICLAHQGRSAEAEPMLRQALKKQRINSGENHRDTSMILSNLATCISDQGRHAEAEPLFREALEKLRVDPGEDHPDTLKSLSSLSACVSAQGRSEDAEPMLRDALNKRRTVLGEDHPDTLKTHSSLATCVFNLGRHKKAEKMYRETLDKLRVDPGEGHPFTLSILSSLAVCIDKQGRHEKAVPMFREALEKQRVVLGEDHPDTLATLNALNDCISAQQHRKERGPE